MSSTARVVSRVIGAELGRIAKQGNGFEVSKSFELSRIRLGAEAFPGEQRNRFT